MLPYTKLCEIEDFQTEELRRLITQIFDHEFDPALEDDETVADSKRWEIAMAVRTLEDHDVLQRSADVLGVGAGLETTSYFLTKRVGRVFATDIYANAGVWSYGAPVGMLLDPSRYHSADYEEDRLLPMHMDARRLRFPDESFDGIYSSGSIEHLGSLEYVANCAHEMGRVIKKGGVLTVATEFKLSGPHDGIGWDPFVILFDPGLLNKHIIEASGLSLLGDATYEISDATAKLSQPLVEFLGKVDRKEGAIVRSEAYPNLVLSHEGYAFGSVHLALYKPRDYVGGSNAWAAPSEQLLDVIAADNASSVEVLAGNTRKAQPDMSSQNPNSDDPRNVEAMPLGVIPAWYERLTAGRSTKIGTTIVVDANDGDMVLQGPRVNLTAGDYIFEVNVAGGQPAMGQLLMEITSANGAVVHQTRSASLQETALGTTIRTRTVFLSSAPGVEIKLTARSHVVCMITSITIRPTTFFDRARGRIRRELSALLKRRK